MKCSFVVFHLNLVRVYSNSLANRDADSPFGPAFFRSTFVRVWSTVIHSPTSARIPDRPGSRGARERVRTKRGSGRLENGRIWKSRRAGADVRVGRRKEVGGRREDEETRKERERESLYERRSCLGGFGVAKGGGAPLCRPTLNSKRVRPVSPCSPASCLVAPLAPLAFPTSSQL